MVLIILLYSVWSLAFPFGKWLLQYSSPIFITSIRMILAGVLLLTYLYIRKKIPKKKISTRAWLSIVALGFFSIYLTNIFEFWSLQHLTASKTCFIYSLCPFFTILLSYIHFKEKMTRAKWTGVIIGFLGFIPTIMAKTQGESLLGAFSVFSWPEISMIFAAFFSVYGWIILRIIVKDEALSPVFANGMSMLIGGIFALGTSFIFDSWTPIPMDLNHTSKILQMILLFTIISNILCYNLYGYLLKKYTATILSFFGLLSPIFTSIHSFIWLGETPSYSIFLSTMIVSLGLWIVYKEELRQGYINKEIETADSKEQD